MKRIEYNIVKGWPTHSRKTVHSCKNRKKFRWTKESIIFNKFSYVSYKFTAKNFPYCLQKTVLLFLAANIKENDLLSDKSGVLYVNTCTCQAKQ